MKLARIVTIPEAFVHIEFQIQEFNKQGFATSLVCTKTESFKEWEKRLNTTIIPIKIPREISVFQDLKALITLYLLFKKEKFDIVHSSTPKAGLLSSIAGFFARVPIRLHTFTGQRWATLSGFKRKLLMFLDHLVVTLNTQCYTDSPSQVDFLVSNKIAKIGKLKCLGKGSFGGVNTKRFHPLPIEKRADLEAVLDLKPTPFRFIFLGRCVADKGLNELVEAFDQLSKVYDCELLLVGSTLGEQNPISKKSRKLIENNTKIITYGPTMHPEKLLQISDMLVLPSYREGFGTSVIEAASCRVATIGTNIPGLKDAIINGETGILISLKSTSELYEAMKWCLTHREDVSILSQKAFDRCVYYFDSTQIAKLVMNEYSRLIKMLQL